MTHLAVSSGIELIRWSRVDVQLSVLGGKRHKHGLCRDRGEGWQALGGCGVVLLFLEARGHLLCVLR